MVASMVLTWVNVAWCIAGIIYIVCSAIKGYAVVEPAFLVGLGAVVLVMVTAVSAAVEKQNARYGINDVQTESYAETNTRYYKPYWAASGLRLYG